jgi:nitrogen fixation-related uncharacterized protein
MSVEVVALAGGILFVLVAIVGGGFTIRELVMPRVPHWARAASAVFGLLLLVPFLLTVLNGQFDRDARPASDTGFDQAQPEERGTGGIELDTEPETTGDNLRITGLTATVRNDPARVGDTVAVDYSLTNVGGERLQLDTTFVVVRDPADENMDSEAENENRLLEPGETVHTSGRIFLDSAGTWLMFPCYTLPGDRYCPDEWKAFNVIVE